MEFFIEKGLLLSRTALRQLLGLCGRFARARKAEERAWPQASAPTSDEFADLGKAVHERVCAKRALDDLGDKLRRRIGIRIIILLEATVTKDLSKLTHRELGGLLQKKSKNVLSRTLGRHVTTAEADYLRRLAREETDRRREAKALQSGNAGRVIAARCCRDVQDLKRRSGAFEAPFFHAVWSMHLYALANRVARHGVQLSAEHTHWLSYALRVKALPINEVLRYTEFFVESYTRFFVESYTRFLRESSTPAADERILRELDVEDLFLSSAAAAGLDTLGRQQALHAIVKTLRSEEAEQLARFMVSTVNREECAFPETLRKFDFLVIRNKIRHAPMLDLGRVFIGNYLYGWKTDESSNPQQEVFCAAHDLRSETVDEDLCTEVAQSGFNEVVITVDGAPKLVSSRDPAFVQAFEEWRS